MMPHGPFSRANSRWVSGLFGPLCGARDRLSSSVGLRRMGQRAKSDVMLMGRCVGQQISRTGWWADGSAAATERCQVSIHTSLV